MRKKWQDMTESEKDYYRNYYRNKYKEDLKFREYIKSINKENWRIKNDYYIKHGLIPTKEKWLLLMESKLF